MSLSIWRESGYVCASLSYNSCGTGDDQLWAYGGNENDALAAYGSSNQALNGGQGEDALTAWSSANILSGGQGDDTLRAYGDDNALSGGAGRDTFVIRSGSEGNIVEDFQAHGVGKLANTIEDVLDLRDIFGGAVALADLVDNGYLIVDSSANVAGGAANDTVVRVDMDGATGPATPVTIVTLTDATLGTGGQDASNWLV